MLFIDPGSIQELHSRCEQEKKKKKKVSRHDRATRLPPRFQHRKETKKPPECTASFTVLEKKNIKKKHGWRRPTAGGQKGTNNNKFQERKDNLTTVVWRGADFYIWDNARGFSYEPCGSHKAAARLRERPHAAAFRAARLRIGARRLADARW
jgi:hypothetical protein